MNNLRKTIFYIFFFILSTSILTRPKAQNLAVSYAYDNAGNRISRKIIDLSVNPNPSHVKMAEDPAPVEEQLGERTITIYPNPTKGMLGVEIMGGDPKDQLLIILYNADGKQLLHENANPGINSINLATYPAAFYILRI